MVLFKEQFSNYKRIRLKMFRRICQKHGILLKINSATDTLIIICRKCSEQTFLSTIPGTTCHLPQSNLKLFILPKLHKTSENQKIMNLTSQLRNLFPTLTVTIYSLCVKSVRIWSLSGPYFPTFKLNERDAPYLSLFSPNTGKYRP